MYCRSFRLLEIYYCYNFYFFLLSFRKPISINKSERIFCFILNHRKWKKNDGTQQLTVDLNTKVHDQMTPPPLQTLTCTIAWHWQYKVFLTYELYSCLSFLTEFQKGHNFVCIIRKERERGKEGGKESCSVLVERDTVPRSAHVDL